MRRTNDIVSRREIQTAGLHGSLSRILEEPAPGHAQANHAQANHAQAGQAPLWAPPVDVAETETEIVLYAELPGMARNEIDINLQGDTLIMRGERHFAPVASGEHFHRIERHYGPWRRAFQIEVPVDDTAVTATYENGVLTVRLPKKKEPKTRQIQIDVR